MNELPDLKSEDIRGVANKLGEEKRFLVSTVLEDTLHAQVEGTTYKIALADVEGLWVMREDKNTKLLVAAAVVVLLIGLSLGKIKKDLDDCQFLPPEMTLY